MILREPPVDLTSKASPTLLSEAEHPSGIPLCHTARKMKYECPLRKKGRYMNKLQIEKQILGIVRTNCYLAVNKETKECIIIDPADEAVKVRVLIEEQQLKPAAILLTHGHYDHIGAAEELAQRYRIPICAGSEEKEVLEDAGLNLSAKHGISFTVCADRLLINKEIAEMAGFQIQVLHTPGHTKGGTCYYFAREGVLFSGDTLFYESIGRTDLPTGSMTALVHSVNELLQMLPDSTDVYPGHGSATDAAHEKKFNPFISASNEPCAGM